MEKLDQSEVKIDFMLFPKWLFFQLNFVQKNIEWNIVFLGCGNFIDMSLQLSEKLILKKRL